MKKDKWFLLQEWVADAIKEISPYSRSTKASGAVGEKGDVFNSCNLNIECKCYQKKNVWEIDWLKKANAEIPLHSNKIAIVVTENKKEEKVVHLNADDFFNLYKRLWKLENGE